MQKNTNQLFETLLGEDASALVSKDPTKDDGESTQMSSILGPLYEIKKKRSHLIIIHPNSRVAIERREVC